LLAHSITDPALALRGSDVVDGLRALNTVIGDR